MIFFVFSFLICFALPAAFKRFLSKSRLSLNKEKPMFLGVALYLSVFIVFIYYILTEKNIAWLFPAQLLAGSSVILLVGILDDMKNFSVKTKLLGQIAAAGLAVSMGVRMSIAYFPVWLNIVITLIWIVALINAFNFLDIMDGLCVGVSFIICSAFLAISIFSGAYSISVFYWILSGSLLAALIHNMPSARFYLGDSGSMLIGFIFACSTMQISYAPDFMHRLSLFVPIVMVALPLYDLIFTVFIRLKKKIPIFKKSSDHLALMLKNKGFSMHKVLIIMYSACLLAALSAFLLKALPLFLKPWLLTFFVAALFAWHMVIIKNLKD